MNYETAKKKILEEDIKVTKHSWNLCKLLRKGTEADLEYTNYTVTDQVVEDCTDRICDCKIAIFQPTEDDLIAEDYVIAI